MGIQAETLKNTSPSVSSPEDWFIGGGEMGKLVRSMDWVKTASGPIESLHQSLRTTVSLCLASKCPIALACGPKHIQIYTDECWPIRGGKRSHSQGEVFSECSRQAIRKILRPGR